MKITYVLETVDINFKNLARIKHKETKYPKKFIAPTSYKLNIKYLKKLTS